MTNSFRGVLGLKVVGYLQEFGSYDFAVGFKLFIKRNSTWYENHMTWIDHIHRITNRRGRLGNLGKQFTRKYHLLQIIHIFFCRTKQRWKIDYDYKSRFIFTHY